ncbi:MAG: S8 family serine peptidase [Verrucomicrobia bacterium]|nr:S8 family serine peptidase [Verrucomicrobiota bacterium]
MTDHTALPTHRWHQRNLRAKLDRFPDTSGCRAWHRFFLLLGLAVSTSGPAMALEDGALEFRMPHPVRYRIETSNPTRAATAPNPRWLPAVQLASTNQVLLGSRIAVQTVPGVDFESLVELSPLSIVRRLSPDWGILQAPDARTAVQEAARLAQFPEVRISYPVMRRALGLHGPYAARPNDTYYSRQWNLENRAADGAPLGVDLNTRAAWSYTRGEGVALAVVDDGIDLAHPEFSSQAQHPLHFNFAAGTSNGLPVGLSDNHGTAVAGLAAAAWNNDRGMAGVAPAVQLASWKIFLGNTLDASDEQLMDMFQYRSDVVGVQNHSWGNSGLEQLAPTPLEALGVSNAIAFGRQGRGVLMIRSGGNGREQLSDANDDAYASDPRVVTVAAVRRDGRATSYSTPGACLLVAAPGGGSDANLFTTDRRGSSGFNTGSYPDDYADYVSSAIVQGTSFSAPQISGLAALLLSVNPNLTYRDVQLILALASRHFDETDPDLAANGAGLRVSHNAGFGVPDAGFALDLARRWVNRPPLTQLSYPALLQSPIPDDGLRVSVTGDNPVPQNLATIPGTPSLGVHADAPTLVLPLVDIGLATPPVTVNLSGKAALIQRGTHLFIDKINAAAQAGAAFAIIYNNVDATERLIMAATDFAPIPALFIDQSAGESLRDQLALDPSLRARMTLTSARHHFTVTDTLVCEHVGLRVRTTHERRGDLRITLLSPTGTRSVLQRINNDNSPGPSDWTYYSVHHFLEPSRGRWQVDLSDEQPLQTGTVTELELILHGVPITDTDGDGLDDDWELTQYQSLNHGPLDDSDADGYSNAFEQVLGTNAATTEPSFQADLSRWSDDYLRLSWPGTANAYYQVLATPLAAAAPDLMETVPGRFPVTELFLPVNNLESQKFFRVQAPSPGAVRSSP